MPRRTHQPIRLWMHELAEQFLVVCPKCNSCAQVRRVGERVVSATGAQVTCTSCGLAKRSKLASWSPGNKHDWYFHLSLWLQTTCLAHTLGLQPTTPRRD